MSDNHTRGNKDVPVPDMASLDARGNDDDPAAELDLRVAVDDFTRSFTPTDPAAVLDRLRRVPVGGSMTGAGGLTGHGNRASAVMPKSGPRPPSSGECTPELTVQLVGSLMGGKTVLAAYLQALAARPVAHDTQVWLVDGRSGAGAHADASALQGVLDVLNDLTTCPGRASHVLSHSHHTLDQLNMQAVDGPPRALWIPPERDSNWRTACLQAGENEQDLDILTEIIACARPVTGRAVADDVRFTLSTLCTEISRRSRLSRGEAPWVRFLDFTWPAPVVGRSLADLLQHQAPDAADAWRVWSMGHSISLSRHMPGVWERHAVPRHDIAAGAVFVLLSANACRTLTVPPTPAQRRPARPDPVPRGDQSSEHRHSTLQSADGACARYTAGDEPSGRKRTPPGAAAGGGKAAEPDPQLHVSQRIDDFLTTITIRGEAGQESRDKREHQRMEPSDTLQAIAPVLDERTVQAIKAYEPGEDTLPDIERLLLSAAR